MLDQGFLAGLGNIYTDEVLHTSQAAPFAGARRSLSVIEAGSRPC